MIGGQTRPNRKRNANAARRNAAKRPFGRRRCPRSSGSLVGIIMDSAGPSSQGTSSAASSGYGRELAELGINEFVNKKLIRWQRDRGRASLPKQHPWCGLWARISLLSSFSSPQRRPYRLLWVFHPPPRFSLRSPGSGPLPERVAPLGQDLLCGGPPRSSAGLRVRHHRIAAGARNHSPRRGTMPIGALATLARAP